MEALEAKKVLAGEQPWSIDEADALAFLRALPADSVDFFFSSPPYAGKGERYSNGLGNKKWHPFEWVNWMLELSEEAVRVCRGDVLWVVNGFVKDSQYHPAVEGLIWKWYERQQTGRGMDHPCIWTKNAPPNRQNWFGNNWEYVVCFRGREPRKTWNWEAVAQPPKYKAGGRFRQRDKNGERKLGGEYPQNKLVRPRDVVYVPVGGGHMGSPLACQNEAPFPELLVENFLPVLTQPGDIVLDSFSGSGTVAKVALKHGRRFIGSDVRSSQVELTKQRMKEVENAIGISRQKAS